MESKNKILLPRGFKTLKAVWDAGADTTCIHPRIVKELGFEPYGQMEIEGYGGVEIDETYAVHLKLPTGDWSFCIEASASDNLKSFDIIIGMDVIGFGDFVLPIKMKRVVSLFESQVKNISNWNRH